MAVGASTLSVAQFVRRRRQLSHAEVPSTVAKKNTVAILVVAALVVGCALGPALVRIANPSGAIGTRSVPSTSAIVGPPTSAAPVLSRSSPSPTQAPSWPPSPSPAGSSAPTPGYPEPPTTLPSVQILASIVSHGPATRRVVAITIDDGFSPSAVLADLAILEREHVNATWFPIGRLVAKDPAPWRRVAAARFPIANHTYDHALLAKRTYAQILADVTFDNEVVGRLIGEPLVPFLRPSGGSWTPSVLAAAAASGERAVVLWSATTGDTAPMPGRSNVDDLVRNATKGTSGAIILMHANLPYTQLALPRIIAYYRARGFEFVTLGQMFGVAGPIPFP